MPPIRVTQLTGDAHAMGVQHGRAHAQQIAELTEDRLRLCRDGFWVGDGNADVDVFAVADRCWDAQRRYDEPTTAEIEGLASATNIPPRDLLSTSGFTDFVDAVRAAASADAAPSPADAGGCTAVLAHPAATADGRPYLAQTWDMHASATDFVVMLDARSADAATPRAMVFTVTGCVGMIGMNDAGLSVGINNLASFDGTPGVMWTTVVRRMLRETTADAALAVLKAAPLAGAHHYLLLDAAGIGYAVEASPKHRVVRPLEHTLAHTNHCLHPETAAHEAKRDGVPSQSSRLRLDRAHAWLDDHAGRIDRAALWSLLRQRDPDPDVPGICHSPLHGYAVDTAGAVVMSPTDRRLDAVWGNPDRTEEQSFDLSTQSNTDATPAPAAASPS
ncbi:MAG: C45 family peptidase [Planctomycetota bacterium]